jgi:hypothetical protein
LFLFTTTFWPFRSSSDTSRCQFTKYKQSSIGSKALIYFSIHKSNNHVTLLVLSPLYLMRRIVDAAA